MLRFRVPGLGFRVLILVEGFRASGLGLRGFWPLALRLQNLGL